MHAVEDEFEAAVKCASLTTAVFSLSVRKPGANKSTANGPADIYQYRSPFRLKERAAVLLLGTLVSSTVPQYFIVCRTLLSKKICRFSDSLISLSTECVHRSNGYGVVMKNLPFGTRWAICSIVFVADKTDLLCRYDYTLCGLSNARCESHFNIARNRFMRLSPARV